MKVRHERPMAELDFSVTAPLRLELASGESVVVSQWSLRGFQYPDDVDVLPKEAVLSIPFQGVDVRFSVELLEGDTPGFLQFVDLTGRQRETLSVFYQSLLSGRMAVTDDIITSLDCPVDLVPMGETDQEAAEASKTKSPRSLRAALNVFVYLAIGCLVFWTLGAGIYGKLATVGIHNARVEAPLMAALAVDTAYVKEIPVAVGTSVRRGDILVRLTTPDNESALSDVRGRINLLEARLLDVQARETAVLAQYAAMRDQFLLGFRTTSDETRVPFLAAAAAFDAGLSAEGQGIHDLKSALSREVDATQDELRRLRRDRGRLRGASDALHVRAAENGIVTQIDVLKGQLVSRGTGVAVVEANTARQVRGWLDQNMTASVHLGMPIDVRINTNGQTQKLQGRISAIEAGIEPEISPDFGMLVTVDLDLATPGASRAMLPHLMPVEVTAQRPWAVSISNLVRGIFAGTQG